MPQAALDIIIDSMHMITVPAGTDIIRQVRLGVQAAALPTERARLRSQRAGKAGRIGPAQTPKEWEHATQNVALRAHCQHGWRSIWLRCGGHSSVQMLSPHGL